MIWLFHLFSVAGSVPIQAPSIAPLFSAVTRVAGHPDTLYPTACPSSCEELFHAEETASNDSQRSCACVCPSYTPVFLNTAGYCVGKLDECRRNLAFQTTQRSERYIPVFSLPAEGGVVNTRVPILWKDTGIGVSETGEVNCSVTGIFIENALHRWFNHHRRDIFTLGLAHKKTAIIWRGSENEASEFAGSVVQLKVSCARFIVDEHCLSFRIAGVSESMSGVGTTVASSRVEVVVLILLAVLLFVTLFGSFVIWNVCWRMKKEKLMQFLNHFRQQQQAKAACQQESCDYGDQSYLGATPKRRLFFSAEYLDEEMMANPPAVAEQFLLDLRRMIDLAKERIRQKRHIPSLYAIPEEEHTVYQPYMTETSVRTDFNSPPIQEETSPKSGKSVDSGRESIRDEEDDSSIEDEKERRNDAVECDRVKQLVNGFESRSTPPVSTSSRIPVASKVPPRSPRAVKAHQQLSVAALAAETIPPLPPTPPPPPPPEFNKENRKISDNRTAADRRKAYAVFPVDPMLNKSLPRRPKRPRPIEAV